MLINTKHLLFILPILLFFSSCKKEEEDKKTTDGTPMVIVSKPANGKTWYIGTNINFDFSVAASNGTVSKIRQVFATKKFDNGTEEPFLIFDFDMANNKFRKSDTTFTNTVTVHTFKGFVKLRDIKGTEVYSFKAVTSDGFSAKTSVTLNVTDVSLLPVVAFVMPINDTTVNAGASLNLKISCSSNSVSQSPIQQFKIMLSLDNQSSNPFLDSTLIPLKDNLIYESIYKTRDSVDGTEKLIINLTDESGQTGTKELIISTIK